MTRKKQNRDDLRMKLGVRLVYKQLVISIISCAAGMFLVQDSQSRRPRIKNQLFFSTAERFLPAWRAPQFLPALAVPS